ncbi:Hypp4375 [Branchiostoma lanceolatum]|uniref:Hypp4375 protein n=1 Tax=Branchiostoma lanceolatum TaxID=7740 RepID=A0A8K0A7V6_BRALA|nr:Hypp4375 [Branchiostoma lanceolatum]
MSRRKQARPRALKRESSAAHYRSLSAAQPVGCEVGKVAGFSDWGSGRAGVCVCLGFINMSSISTQQIPPTARHPLPFSNPTFTFQRRLPLSKLLYNSLIKGIATVQARLGFCTVNRWNVLCLQPAALDCGLPGVKVGRNGVAPIEARARSPAQTINCVLSCQGGTKREHDVPVYDIDTPRRPPLQRCELENALASGAEGEEVDVKEDERDCVNNNNNNNGPANQEGSGESEEGLSNNMADKGTEVQENSPHQPSEEGSPGCLEEGTRQIYRCDTCGTTLATLSDFMDHRNYVCGSAVKCSTLEAEAPEIFQRCIPRRHCGVAHSQALMSCVPGMDH